MRPRFAVLIAVLTLLALPAPGAAAPPPPCDCDLCEADPSARCIAPNGSQVRCITMIRSGICLGEPLLPAPAAAEPAAAFPGDAAAPAACRLEIRTEESPRGRSAED